MRVEAMSSRQLVYMTCNLMLMAIMHFDACM